MFGNISVARPRYTSEGSFIMRSIKKSINTYAMSGEDFIKYATVVDDGCDIDTVDGED